MLEASHLLHPRQARTLPPASRERAFAAVCLRLVWHAVFDTAPGVLARDTPDGTLILEPFLSWADAHALVMDWSLHLHLLAWLDAQPAFGAWLDEAQVTELLAAAASKWALSDQSADKGIMVASDRLPGRAVLAWKPPSLEEGRKVLLVQLDGAVPPPARIGWQPLADAGALGQARPWRSLHPGPAGS